MRLPLSTLYLLSRHWQCGIGNTFFPSTFCFPLDRIGARSQDYQRILLPEPVLGSAEAHYRHRHTDPRYLVESKGSNPLTNIVRRLIIKADSKVP